MRYALIIAAIAVVVAAAGRTAQAAETSSQIGVVDMKRIYEESKYKDEYEKRIQEMYTNAQVEVSERRQKIEAMKKDRWLVTEERRAKKDEEIANEEKKLNDFITEARKQVEDQKRAFLEEFEKKVIGIVEEVAVAEKMGLVLNNAVVIYNKDARDLTDAVLEKLNQLFVTEHPEKSTEKTTEKSTEGATGGD